MNPGWQKAAPVQQISVPITDPGTDVLVRMTAPTCYGFCPPEAALMIDGLRLE